MEKICVFCGNELNESGICNESHSIKKMCVNCHHVKYEDGTYYCCNEDNMSDTKTKMIEAANSVAGGYSFSIEVNPLLPLKKPVAKCPRWQLGEFMFDEFKNMFN